MSTWWLTNSTVHKSKLSFSLLIKSSVILALWCFANWCFGHVGRVEKEKSERKRKWKLNVEIFTLFDVKMIQIYTFPADPSTERVPSLAERVAYLRHPINLRLFNWRVPALISTVSSQLIFLNQIKYISLSRSFAIPALLRRQSAPLKPEWHKMWSRLTEQIAISFGS